MADTAAPRDSQGAGLAHLSTGRARAALWGVAWSFVNIAVSTLLAAIVFLVTSRILGPEDFGAVAFAASVITFVAVLIPGAFGEALVQRAELRQDHLDTLFWIVLGFALAGYGLLLALSSWIAGWSDFPLLETILPILGLRLIFDALLTVPASLIVRRMQFRSVAIRTAVANGIGAVVCLAMVLTGYALWALVMSQVITSLTGMIVAFAAAGWRPGWQIRWQSFRELLGFGGYAMGGKVLYELRMDQFLLGALLGPAVLGLFYFGRRLFQMLKDLTVGCFAPVSSVLLASLQHEGDKRRKAYLAASYTSAGLAFPVFAGLMAIAPTAVPLAFGAQWTDAVFAVQCFCVIGVMAGLGLMQAALIRNLGRSDWWFWYQAVVQLSAIPIILIFYRFGLDAVMAALAVRTIVMWPTSVRMAQRMLDMPLWDYVQSLRGPTLGSLAMVAWVLVLPKLWPDLSQGALLLTQVGSGAVLYGLVLALTSFGRLREIAGMIRRPKGRAQ
ncbi:lipopolysaccharide biosynthesis protein [Tabrizicola sp.]|uniref:lipopolysaccharide biosynthesis protein n=1 Tax=Tabrizicola sp. TaxID=2005166 RepID=UPI003F2BE16D